ncbi:DUF3040 domain-containing protein [Pseudonocardia sp. TRM90224]|uniref:DUF3040 domain-containing protein n=1 Tax=Pseudonocardia sp. TRM90224 TaxID=2812678 RepID=UPI001E3CBC5C|nr:DUF3040 domain-containing protein [Pseudonocardia sp. TRM90224]
MLDERPQGRPHGRRLTEAERTRLDALERQLDAEDPALATMLQRGVPRLDQQSRAVLGGVVLAALLLVALAMAIGGAGGGLAMAATLLVTAGACWVGRRVVRELR